MYLTHTCPICGKEYEREYTPEPDKVCPHCELESIVNPAIRYYIAGKEVVKEEYQRFLKGEDENNFLMGRP